MTYLAAIDAGTGSGRCVIFDSDGNQVAFASQEWSHPSLPEYPGSQIFNTDENWKILCSCLKEAIQKAAANPHEIAGVSATSMREGMVLYDDGGHEIWACPNVDSRARNEVTQMVRKGLAKKIYSRGGDWLSITSPPRFQWIRRHEPEILKRTSHMTMISDWIIYKLTGRFVTDPSAGSSSNLFQLSKRTWSKEIIEWCGLPNKIFSPVEEPGTVIGEVTKNASNETGLSTDTKVVMGGADTQLALIGVGAVEAFSSTTIGGTFWQQTVVTEKPLIDPKIRLRTLCHAVPGQWITEGIGFYCGLTTRWFRDAFCERDRELAEKEGVDPYYILEKQASEVPPGSNGLFPIFSDIMNAKRWMHAAPSFIQFNVERPAQSGKKECFRAIEESAAYVSLGHMKIIESIARHKMKEVVFCGGGAKGFLWPQILADVFGIRIKVPTVKESTALGAAICAGVGVGVFHDLKSAGKNLVRWERTFEPNQNNHTTYRALFKKWNRIYNHMLDLVEEGIVQPMWRAAGT